jgi:arylsulfatase A-like enzyme
MNWNCLETYWRSAVRWAGIVLLAGGSVASLSAQTNLLIKMPPPAPRRPSIILILADNLGYGDLGSYGQAKIKTPNLDKLATEGIRFTSFYTGSPEDAAARAALLTGREPRHLPADFNQVLPADALTLSAQLKQLGYHTGLIGTWGLGDAGVTTPIKHGFDEFAGFLSTDHARNYFTDRLWRAPAPEGYDGQAVFSENQNGRHGFFMPDLLADMAVNFIRLNKPEPLNHHRPFFLCLAYPIPHVTANAAPPGNSEYADAPWPPLERIRATLVSRMDDGVGKVLSKLDELKIRENTVVIFASLGGPEKEPAIAPELFRSTGGFRGQQGSLNEGGLRVPLVIRWPAQIKAGGVSDLPCAGWDVLPTARELAFSSPPETLDGLSLLPTLLGQTQTNRHESLYWETSANGGQQAVRLGEWKAIRSGTNALELFNLKTDPGEKKNLAAKPAEVVAKVEKLFNPGRPQVKQP